MSEETGTAGALKPCPFCGGEAESEWLESKYRAGGLYLIRCGECGASGGTVKTLYTPIFGGEIDPELLEAAELWNARAPDEGAV